MDPSAPGSRLRVHHRSQGACVASLDAFVLMRCYGDVPVAALEASVDAHDAAIAASPLGSASLVVVDPSTPFPPESVRTACVAAMKKTKGGVRAAATVLRGDGFWASAIRGAVTALYLVAPSSHPVKICREIDEALDWILEELPDLAPRRAEVARAIATMGP